ncbi:MAG: O-methyltransferase [Christensenellales bacterium]
MLDKLEEILKFGRDFGFPLIRDDSANFLVETVRQYQPKKVLEIGTAIGYSGSLILSCCDCKLITIEKNEQSAKIAKDNFARLGFENRVQVVNDDAKNFIDNCNDKFDFIFLDGPKGQYLHYKEKLINMLNNGGVLFADNVLFRGLVKSSEQPPKQYKTIVNNMRAFLNEIENDDRLETTIYTLGDGVSVSIKK